MKTMSFAFIHTTPQPQPQVSAVGKYCYVVPSEDELDFGDQAVVAGGGVSGSDQGSRPRKEFTITNQSVVPAAFNVSGGVLLLRVSLLNRTKYNTRVGEIFVWCFILSLVNIFVAWFHTLQQKFIRIQQASSRKRA